jgi:6-phosphogluconolactonase (cycloisomerase 2 family)
MQPIGWTTAGDGVYAVRSVSVGNLTREIYVASSSGGELRLFATLAQGFVPRDVTISPDGRLVVAAVEETRTDVWVVEDFDPERR